jgi:CRP/FNR family transcriptional regulator
MFANTSPSASTDAGVSEARTTVSFRAADSAAQGSACSTCRMRALCLPSGLSDSDVKQVSALVFPHRRLKVGQALYRSGDTFRAVYLIRTGTVKTLVLHEDGREQVSGFYMPGEMCGMDGLASGKHASDAVALEDCDVCVVPYDRLELLSRESRGLQRYLHRVLSNEVVRNQSMMLLLGSMRAEERVASFLLNLSQRLTARGYSASDFILRMTRDEIGSLLGMKLETVSRIFSRFQKEGMVHIEGKHVQILKLDSLRAMIGH